MERNLSSAWTFIYKYLFPVFWIALFGYSELLLFISPESVTYNGVKGGAPPEAKWMVLIVIILGAVFILRKTMPLKHVRSLNFAAWQDEDRKFVVQPSGGRVSVAAHRRLKAKLLTRF